MTTDYTLREHRDSKIVYQPDFDEAAKERVLKDIQEVFKLNWKPGFGSITAQEAVFIRTLVSAYKPSRFLEVGMASGISCGIIAGFLDLFDGKEITSVDHDNTFFGDQSKPNGFLIDKIYNGGHISIDKKPFHTTVDLGVIGKTFDMVFVDANHQHPWPTLDTLLVYPWIKGEKIIIHHDYNLYFKQRNPIGIGPKYLYDQFPDFLKLRSPEDDGNIFALSLDIETHELEEIAIGSLMLPWTLQTPLTANGDQSLSNKITAVLSEHYSERLVATFLSALDKFGVGLSHNS
jgi:hypothetical protein